MHVRRERLLLGFRGLALLRGWPLGDAPEAEAQIESMKDAIRRDPESIDIALWN